MGQGAVSSDPGGSIICFFQNLFLRNSPCSGDITRRPPPAAVQSAPRPSSRSRALPAGSGSRVPRAGVPSHGPRRRVRMGPGCSRCRPLLLERDLLGRPVVPPPLRTLCRQSRSPDGPAVMPSGPPRRAQGRRRRSLTVVGLLPTHRVTAAGDGLQHRRQHRRGARRARPPRRPGSVPSWRSPSLPPPPSPARRPSGR